MESKEPLLKEEVETFPFLEENKKKEKKPGKINFSLIFTIILAVIILAFAARTLYAFYVGFKYYNLRFEDTSLLDNSGEKEIDTSSAVLNNTYNKYNATVSSSLLNILYTGSEVSAVGLTQTEKLEIVFDYLKVNCSNLNAAKSRDEVSSAALSLFNDASILNSINSGEEVTVGNYKVRFNATNNTYSINRSVCEATGDFLDRSIQKATTKDDELYVYEKFGLFVKTANNVYDVYGDANKTNLLSTFTDSEGRKNFPNKDVLKTYKWTYKKSNGNNYYLVSVTPM